MEKVGVPFSLDSLMIGIWRRFLSQFDHEVMVEGVEDKLLWKETNYDIFSVKSMYKTLVPRSCELFPWMMMWKSCLQSNICFFAWEAIWGKILG